MILKIRFRSGEKGVNRREFELEAFHMDPPPDTIAPMLVHLTDLMTSLDPQDTYRIFTSGLPLPQAEVTGHDHP
jgi:hypothetical protein